MDDDKGLCDLHQLLDRDTRMAALWASINTANDVSSRRKISPDDIRRQMERARHAS